MSTRYYDLPGIAAVTVTTDAGMTVLHLAPDPHHRDTPPLGPLTIVGSEDDCLRILRAWAEAHRHEAAYRANGVIRVTSTQPDAHPAISEYGDLTTVGALRRGEAP